MKPISLILLAALLAGCATASGVKVPEAAVAACKTQHCTIFTDAALRELAQRFYVEGYRQAIKDAAEKAL